MKFGLSELVFAMLLLALPVGAHFWVLKPARENIKEQKTQLEAKAAKLESLREAMAGAKDLNKEVEKLAEAVEFFESKLPGHHEIHKVLAQVTKISESHGLETKLFQTLKRKPFASYSEQPIRMEVYGDFDAYYQFLLDLEKLPRITKIKEMELLKDKQVEGAMHASFTLSIYFDSQAAPS